jgi:hypothetical protein
MTAGTISFFTGEDPLRASKLNAAFAERLLLAGDTMAGPLILSRPPVLPFEAATKAYIDNLLTVKLLLTVSDTPPGSVVPNTLWWHSAECQLYIYYDDGTSQQWVPASTLSALNSYAPLNSPVFTGDARAVTPAPGDNDTSIATTAFVQAAIVASGSVSPSNAIPTINGTAAAGTSALYTRGDHVHPTDTSRAAASALASYLPLSGGTVSGGTAFTTGIILASPSNINVGGGSPGQVLTAGSVGNQIVWGAAGTPNNVGRNLVHNPLFNVAQRGVGPFTTNISYTADRWQLFLASDTASIVFPAASDTSRTAIGDEAATFVLSNTFTGNAAAGAFNVIQQKIEGVRRLAGKTVTVSFYAWANVGLKLGVNVEQSFGSGGSPSADVQLAGQAININATWARYTATFVLPSINGKSLGSNNDDRTAVNFWCSSGATNATRAGGIGVQSGNVQLWGVQLEMGSVATPLEKPDPQQDVGKCQRFYCTFIGALFPCGSVAGPAYSTTISWPVTMRATPSVVISGASYGGANSVALGSANTTGFYLSAISTGGAGTFAACNVNASADL